MYLITVLLLMFVLPVGSTWYDYQQADPPRALLFLAGKWFVFSVGRRSGCWIAGLLAVLSSRNSR
jgi:hypothetical protein